MDARLLNALSLVYATGKENDYVIFEDTMHPEFSIMEFFWSTENIDAMVAAGFKRITLEASLKYQPLIDDLVKNTITPEQYADKMVAQATITGLNAEQSRLYYLIRAKGIKYADSRGIVTEARDAASLSPYDGLEGLNRLAQQEKLPNYSIAEIKAFINKGGVFIGEKVNLPPLNNDAEFLKALETAKVPDELRIKSEEFYNSFAKQWEEARGAGDKQVADSIKSSPVKGKTAVVCGISHGNNKDGKRGKDLDEYLAEAKKGQKPAKVAKIAFSPDMATFTKWIDYPGMQEYPVYTILTGKSNAGPLKLAELQVMRLTGLRESDKLGGEATVEEINAHNADQWHYQAVDFTTSKLPEQLRYNPATVRADLAAKATYATGKDAKFLMFQVFNHTDIESYRFFWSHKNLDAAAAAGYKRIALEWEPKLQQLVTQLLKSKDVETYAKDMLKGTGGVNGLSQELSLEVFKIEGAGILYASSKNMKTKFVDVAFDNTVVDRLVSIHLVARTDKLNQTVKGLCDYLRQQTKLPKEQRKPDHISSEELLAKIESYGLADDVQVGSDAFKKPFHDEWDKARITRDKQVAASIEEFAGGEKTMVLYGVMHGATYTGKPEKDMDEYLAGGKNGKEENIVKKIGLMATWKDYTQHMRGYNQEYPVTCIFTEDGIPIVSQLQNTRNSDKIGAEAETDEYTKEGIANIRFSTVLEKAFALLPTRLQYKPAEAANQKAK